MRLSASILYNDLRSIERYIRSGETSVNLRYFENWQQTVALCTFLGESDVEALYVIYDAVYDYNQTFCCGEKTDTYERLEKLLFENLEHERKYTYRYQELIGKFEKNKMKNRKKGTDADESINNE